AYALGLMHGALGFVIVHPFIAHRLRIEDACVVAEGLAQQRGFFFQYRHDLGPVRHIQVAARLRIAVYVLDQLLEVLHALDAFAVHPDRRVRATAADPLRAVQASGSAWRLAAAARAAAPGRAVGLQYGGLDAVFLGQEDGGGQPGEARAYDDHVGIHVLRD